MLMPDEIPTIVRGSRASIPPHMSSDGGALSQAQIMMERLMRREDPHPALKLLTEPPLDEQITLPERVTPGQGDSSSGKDSSSQKSGASSEGPDKRAPKDRVSPAIRHTRFGRQPTTPPRSGRAVGTHFPRRTLSMTPVVGGRYRRDSEHRAPSSPLSIPYPETRPIRPPSPGNSSSTNTSDVPDATEEVPSSSRSTKSPRSSIDSPALSPAIESPVDRTPPRPDNRPPAPLVRAFPTNTQQPRRASSNDVTASPATGVQRGGGSQYLYAGRPTPAAASPDGAPERHPPPRSPSGDLDKMQGRAAWSPERRLTSPHGARRAASASGAPPRIRFRVRKLPAARTHPLRSVPSLACGPGVPQRGLRGAEPAGDTGRQGCVPHQRHPYRRHHQCTPGPEFDARADQQPLLTARESQRYRWDPPRPHGGQPAP
eukprot:TRINITY_DN4521_c0_g1_i1.p1 TRINITY_DN4521_c0_g1~~TRINITY_DN4521_c0_g1_i1.p1  ORF type:complete len:429 (+),score=26.23 TRINITY_DN4521_c0_g1_i1:71-1357(+)